MMHADLTSPDYNSEDFQSELFPLHSPLLRESWLVSFPPLINMLKFSGYSCLIGDPIRKFHYKVSCCMLASSIQRNKSRLSTKEKRNFEGSSSALVCFLKKQTVDSIIGL